MEYFTPTMPKEKPSNNLTKKSKQGISPTYRINVGSIGWVPPEYDGAYISPAYVVFSIDESVILPELFWFILKAPFFNEALRAATAGSVRMNLTYPLLQTLKIPIPNEFDVSPSSNLKNPHSAYTSSAKNCSVLGGYEAQS
ncbi:MAG: hypothetical protein JRH18_25540 [Deltaproteobacteria bacterium]|nr:hypothetical protein [Deltaproteobacteria bacterium]